MTKLTTHTLAGKPLDTDATDHLWADWLDQHIRCDVSGLVTELIRAVLDVSSHIGSDVHIGPLQHTDITIREMRAAVAHAGCKLQQQSPSQWSWIDPDGWTTYGSSELDVAEHCIATNNLDPAQYALEPKQWLAVSDELAPLLRDQGETVREFAGLNIWLRCDTGPLEHAVNYHPLRAIWGAAG